MIASFIFFNRGLASGARSDIGRLYPNPELFIVITLFVIGSSTLEAN
jgi:hypothetical protein